MRILLVNKFIFPKGGAETYTFDVGKMLEEHGHEVQYFGLENEKNTVGNRIGSYVTNMDFSQGIKANLNAPFRIIYSREARKKIRAVLDDFQPDVVHLNNIQYHLTPSIILETNKWRKETKKECKIVYTTHDYQLVCPSHGMFDVDMKPCERCLDGHYIHCLQTKCLKNSRAKSLLGTLDGYMWKYSKAYSYVDAYICCSYFLKSKLDTQKRFRDKTIGLHNFKKEMPHIHCTASPILYYSATNTSFPIPQIGQTQSSGRSSNAVPGAIPLSGSPTSGSYTYPHGSQTYFCILYSPFFLYK